MALIVAGLKLDAVARLAALLFAVPALIEHGLALIEDSTEAIGSRYLGELVGTFGDLSIFDFSQPLALNCGEGGIVLTDDARLAIELRYLRAHGLSDRNSVSVGSRVPFSANMSDVTAAIGIAQA